MADARFSIARIYFEAARYEHAPSGSLELRVVRSGSSYATIDLGAGPRRVFTRVGDVLLSLPDRATVFEIEQGREVTFLEVPARDALGLVRAAGGSSFVDLEPLCVRPFRDPLIAELVRRLEGWTEAPLAFRTSALALVVACLVELSAARSGPATPAALSATQLRDLEKFVDTNIESALTVDMLAEELALPRRAFSRSLRASAGVPAYQFVLQRRVARALALLAASDVPLAEVAVRAGFSHQAHMNRVMRRLKGVTPGEVRSGVARGLADTSRGNG